MKTIQIPSDYEQKFTLAELNDMFGTWTKTIIKIVEIKGFYTCMYGDKKTLIVR